MLAVGPCEPVPLAAGPCTAPPADLEVDAGREAADDLGAEAGLLVLPAAFGEPAMAALPMLRSPERIKAVEPFLIARFVIVQSSFLFGFPHSMLLTLPLVNVTFMSW